MTLLVGSVDRCLRASVACREWAAHLAKIGGLILLTSDAS
jgi:hypothetical protein